MLVQFILIFLFWNCVSTYEEGKTNIEDDSDYDNIYQFWPYKYNTADLIDIIKRDVNPPKAQVQVESNIENSGNEQQKVIKDLAQSFGQSEGGVVNQVPVANATPVLDVNQKLDLVTLNEKPEAAKDKSDIIKTDMIKSNSGNNDTKTNATVAQPISKIEEAPVSHNDTSVEPSNMVDISKPGVVKRGLIVFGGLTLLAVAYFIFYRNKHKKFDAANAHGTGESNQFRYGVLHSDDRRDNLELSRIPLTMESDDDDDEDLEIFDLEQKRKSLSYVSLQANDEDIVLRSSKDESKNNLLLDIEDGPADQLINWSSSGSKSIL